MSDAAPIAEPDATSTAPSTGVVVVGGDAAVVRGVVGALDAALVRPGAALPEGVSVLVWLGPAAGDDPAEDVGGTGVAADPTSLRAALGSAAAHGVRRVVVLSSALVYGAWPDNPVPLTEDAVLRPEPGFAPVARLAELERVTATWAAAHPDVTVVVLRPAITVSDERAGWLAASPWSARDLVVGDAEPPAQYLHLDDLVSAIAHVAADAGGSEVCNVAPDGWLRALEVRALAGPRPRAVLPEDLALRLQAARRRFGRTGVPDGLVPATCWPWVVANDRLRARGWSPTHSNEEAFVAACPAGPLGELDARRRQHLALGGVGAAALGAVGLAVALWRKRVSARRVG